MKEEKYLTENMKLNRFIFFYTLRWLWKANGYSPKELYKLIFPSKRTNEGNKTRFDNILRLKNIELDDSFLSDLIGVHSNYISGKAELRVVGLIDTDWKEFINLRLKSKRKKNQQLIQAENRIHQGLRNGFEDVSKQQPPFRDLAFFAKNKRKQSAITTEYKFEQIKQKIETIGRAELERAEHRSLIEYYKVIKQHCDRIEAIVILKNWD